MKTHPDKTNCFSGMNVTRRQFMTHVGVGALTVAVAGQLPVPDASASEVKEPSDMISITLLINGRRHHLPVEPRWTLLYVLREKIGLTGTKNGCERGECGACTVLIDDVPRYACMMLAVEAEDKAVTTLEGLMDGETLGPVQQAFLENDAFQCGYCTPGQIMAVEGMLRTNPAPSLEEIRQGVSGNLCRCGAYTNIFKAAKRASELKQGK